MRRDKQETTAWTEMGGLAPLAAMAVLFVNDHWLKPAFHNALTGKLSDLAICFLLPLLAATGLGLATGWRLSLRARVMMGSVLGAGLFSALELSDAAGGLFVRFMAVFGRHAVLTRDLGDLAALAVVPLAAAHAFRRAGAGQVFARREGALRRAVGFTATAIGSLALMADSPPAECDKVSPTVVMRAEPGCGKGGLIVLEPNDYGGFLTVHNREALEFAQDGSRFFPTVRYEGGACPFTVEKGDWESDGTGTCAWGAGGSTGTGGSGGGGGRGGVTSDGGAGGAGGSGAQACGNEHHLCRAELEADGLWYTCRLASTSTVLCRSRLTVEP